MAQAEPRQIGAYQITGKLGEGGMGAVYEGYNPHLGRRAAIKVLRANLSRDQEQLARFFNEARATNVVRHPSLVDVYECGFAEDGSAFIIMEYLDGETLRQRSKRQGPLGAAALPLLRQMATALAATHAAKIAHRDLKPDNVMLVKDPEVPGGERVKILDFGIAKLFAEGAAGGHMVQTRDGTMFGTPAYMSPEQCRGSADVKQPSDVYSLGAILFELYAGKPPFTADSIADLLAKHMFDPAPALSSKVPGVPPALDRLVADMLVKDQRARPTMAQVAERLLQIAGGTRKSIWARVVVLGGLLAALGAGAVLLRTPAGARLGPLARLRSPASSTLSPSPSRPQHDPADGGATQAAEPAQKAPIKVGVLHSLTGPLALSERPLADASLLAIEELNAAGGLLGRRVEAVVVDGKSEVTLDSAFSRGASHLLTEEKVTAVFGGFGSAGRKAIKPLFEANNALLFYPASYEGLEESRNIIYTGATPNQFVFPAIKWLGRKPDSRRVFFIGTDGLRPRAIEALMNETSTRKDWKLVDSAFAVVGEVDFSKVITRIRKSKPQLIINVLVGDSSVAFLKQLRDSKALRRDIPTLSLAIGEAELSQLAAVELSGHYIARAHFPLVKPDSGADFARRFQAKYGAHRAVSETMEAAYYGVHLWAEAVKAAGSESMSEVLKALKQKEYQILGVKLRVDPSNQHTWKEFELGRIDAKHELVIVPTGHQVLPPLPYPGARTRVEWDAFLADLAAKWDNNWANPRKPVRPRSK